MNLEGDMEYSIPHYKMTVRKSQFLEPDQLEQVKKDEDKTTLEQQQPPLDHTKIIRIKKPASLTLRVFFPFLFARADLRGGCGDSFGGTISPGLGLDNEIRWVGTCMFCAFKVSDWLSRLGKLCDMDRGVWGDGMFEVVRRIILTSDGSRGDSDFFAKMLNRLRDGFI